MAAKTSLPLPLPSIEYNQSDEAVTRRLIEQTTILSIFKILLMVKIGKIEESLLTLNRL